MGLNGTIVFLPSAKENAKFTYHMRKGLRGRETDVVSGLHWQNEVKTQSH